MLHSLGGFNREVPSKHALRGTGSVMQQEAAGHQGKLRSLEEANHRFLGEARLGVVIAAMVMILIDPSSAAPYAQFGVLLPYGLYSAVVMLRARHGRPGAGLKHAHWVDTACFLLVVGLSGGITSKLFPFLLFPVLVASLQSGLRRGVIAAVVCALLLACVGALRAWLDPGARVWDLSLWPVAVLLLTGLLVARWGNSEFTLWRRLAFLNDLNALASPRCNLDHAMRALAEMLRAYHRADSCIVVMADVQSDGYLLWEANAERDTRMHGERISRELAEPLLRSTAELAMVYSRCRRLWQRTVAGAYDRASLEPRPADPAALEQLANLLETDAFITMPIYFRHRPIGRLYATSRRFRYAQPDLRFLQQVVGQAALVVENIQLLDRLASDIAIQERQKISRDLHDGTIQPYIGLKLGLEALRRGIPDRTPLAVEVDDLTRMAGEGITELRRYVAGLREQAPRARRESLLVAVRRQAEKFTEFYGINAEVMADGDVQLKEPLLQEVMNIVREGLANIRRHTSAGRAVVNLREEGDRLVVQFVNDTPPGRKAARPFFPRSLNERAKELGGRVDVEHREDGWTSVAVEIPV
jgi:signal transduction histidine kinase